MACCSAPFTGFQSATAHLDKKRSRLLRCRPATRKKCPLATGLFRCCITGLAFSQLPRSCHAAREYQGAAPRLPVFNPTAGWGRRYASSDGFPRYCLANLDNSSRARTCMTCQRTASGDLLSLTPHHTGPRAS